jgi:hypothetical protein
MRPRGLLLAVLVLAGCGNDAPKPERAATPTKGCEVSKPRYLNDEIAKGLGNGPAYPVGFDTRSVMEVVLPPPKTTEFRGSQWGGAKTLWAIAPGSTPALTVRGIRLDAPGEVRFQDGKVPPLELQLASASDEWIYVTSYTRLRAHGCYAFIVEGRGVSERIVFRAGRHTGY